MAQEPEFHVTSDYECFINCYNKTKVDFGLDESKVISGTWAAENPPNTIKAGKQKVIQLNDNAGSEGWVSYELYHPKHPSTPITFTLEFCDPYGKWNDNYCHARTSHPTLVSCQVLKYQPTGHPFTAHVEIYLVDADGSIDQEDERHIAQQVELQTDRQAHAAFEIGFNYPFKLGRKEPIHEEIAIAALITSKLRFPKGTTYNNLDSSQWEYMRGLIWNDDPSCLLFENKADNNKDFDIGDDFLHAFYYGSPNCMTRRSHFGNLQFLHSMATRPDEDPNFTKTQLLSWIEVMYKLAIGIQDVSEKSRLEEKLPAHFSGSSDPRGDKSLRDLLLGTATAYRKSDIAKRAIGSCLHLIQDSYAVGHTLRRLRNPEDLDRRDEDNFIRFKPGTYAQLGPIITFHTYDGQSDRHGHYDTAPKDTSRSPRDLDSFNSIIGARDAIDKSRKLLDFFAAKTKWEDGVAGFLANEVFALDGRVTRSNTDVDERFGVPGTSGPKGVVHAIGGLDEEYQAGLERKMALLEGGLAHDRCAPIVERRMGRFYRMLKPSRVVLLAALKYVMAFFGLLVVFAFAQLATKALKLS